MNLFRRKEDTNLHLYLALIGLDKISDIRKQGFTTVTSGWFNSTEKEVRTMQYAFFANLFSGFYKVFFKEGENQIPILIPDLNSSHIGCLQANLDFPRDIVRTFENGSSLYTPRYHNYSLGECTSPVLFCSLSLEGEEVFSRLHFKSHADKCLSCNLGEDLSITKEQYFGS